MKTGNRAPSVVYNVYDFFTKKSLDNFETYDEAYKFMTTCPKSTRIRKVELSKNDRIRVTNDRVPIQD